MNRKLTLIFLLVVIVIVGFACKFDHANSAMVKVVNVSDKVQKDVLIRLDVAQLKLSDSNWDKLVVYDKGVVPFQWVDKDLDGVPEELMVLLDFSGFEEKKLSIKESKGILPELTKRTQAELAIKEGGQWKWVTKKNGNQQFEYKGGHFKNVSALSVPEQHTDHSFYIKYEGPGWESDKVAYRFYIDWRNAVDIFGKKTEEMVLQDVGQDGFESYHEESEWGMDILKVGSSLGMGSIGYFYENKAMRVEKTDSLACVILENGPIYSCFKTNYYGWNYQDSTKTDLALLTSISAGSRLTFQNLTFTNAPNNICTGIVKHKAADYIKSYVSNNEWAYIATFGAQSLNKDNMGMVVFYKMAQLKELTEDSKSYIVVLNPSENQVSYAFAATWEKDSDEINTKNKFINYINKTLRSLNNKPSVSYLK